MGQQEIELIHGKMADPDFFKQPGEVIADAKKLKFEQENLTKVAGIYEAKHKQLAGMAGSYGDKIAALEQRMTEIDGQYVAVQQLREASAIAGDVDESFGDNLADLEAKVDDLDATLKGELAFEESELADATGVGTDDPLAAFTAATETAPENLSSEIDALLAD